MKPTLLSFALFCITKIMLLVILSDALAEEVRLVKDGGVYHLPVNINGAIQLKFVVDTGAADVHLPADVALTLIRTGTISKQDFLGTASYQMADGSIKENAKLNLRSLQVGAKVIRNIEASIGPVESTLLLGQSALEKLEPWRMETRRGVFVFDDHSVNYSNQSHLENPDDSMSQESGVIYYAAELPPKDNIPPEAPLCYKFLVASPEEQLNKLITKYPDLYDYAIHSNNDDSKTLVAKRKDSAGEVVSYFYSTSANRCNDYQAGRIGQNTAPSPNYSDERSLDLNLEKPEIIKFSKGEITHIWKGTIRNGEKRFKLWMRKGQKLRLGGSDVYTWHLLTNKGQKLGCAGSDYCSSVSAINALPYSGDYTIVTTYRMSSCHNCPIAKSRQVTVEFEIY